MNETTSPRILEISGRLNLLLRKQRKSMFLADLPLEIQNQMTVSDIVSMAQSLNTQAKDRPEKPSRSLSAAGKRYYLKTGKNPITKGKP